MEKRWGHPSSQRRRSRSSSQQLSTITSCSYIQSMRKDRFRATLGHYLTNNNRLSTHKSGNKKLNSTVLEYSSHRPYTEGHGEKGYHHFDSARFVKSFRQHSSWSIALQDLRYEHVIGYIKLVQELFVRPLSSSTYWIYAVWRATNHPWGTAKCYFITFTLLHLLERPT